jgi:hypothetical protein
MLVGTADPATLASHAGTMSDFATDALELQGASIFQALFEMRVTAREAVLPPALHPTNPPLLVVLAWDCPDSPWGPFTMTQLRVSCRSGVRPRGLVAACAVSSRDAGDALASRWGFPAVRGEVRLRRHYDGADLEVALGGRTVLAVRALDPDPLSPGDVQYTVGLNLAGTPRGLRLIQVEPEYAVTRAERVRPQLLGFDPLGLDTPLLAPASPVSASIAAGTITIPRLRFACRPDVLAFEGTESVLTEPVR